jgi:Zn-dependent M32 family carboxypeptidase
LLDRPEERDPEAGFKAPDEKAMACAITITSQVGSNRSIVVQTYLDRDASRRDYDVLLDKLTSSVDRQEARLSLEGLELDLKRMEANHDKLVQDFSGIEERAQQAWENRGKKGRFALSAQELTQKQQAMNTIAAGKENIARLKADIEKVRAIATLGANDED